MCEWVAEDLELPEFVVRACCVLWQSIGAAMTHGASGRVVQDRFASLKIDGQMLLEITNQDLQDDLVMRRLDDRRKFLEVVVALLSFVFFWRALPMCV